MQIGTSNDIIIKFVYDVKITADSMTLWPAIPYQIWHLELIDQYSKHSLSVTRYGVIQDLN